jgi:hypothetical protein
LAVISQLVSLQGLLDSSGANGDTLELSILNVSSESKHSRNMNIEEMAAQCCNQELSLADVDAACLFAKISRLDFFDRLAGWISVEFLDRRRDFTFCDYVADNMMPLSEWNLTDFAWSVFLAFDCRKIHKTTVAAGVGRTGRILMRRVREQAHFRGCDVTACLRQGCNSARGRTAPIIVGLSAARGRDSRRAWPDRRESTALPLP